MEQDIEKVENLIKKCDECKLKECINCEISWSEVQAIKRLYEENKELKEKWDKDTHKLQNALDMANADKINNYIPVSLVEETIEERKLWLSLNDIGYKDDYVLEVLQELLERRK